MAILAKVEKKVEKKAVEKKPEKKVEKKAEPIAMKTTKQVMKRKIVMGKFAKTVQQKGKELESVEAKNAKAKLAMKAPSSKGGKDEQEEPKKPVTSAMKAAAKAAVKAKLAAMKAKAKKEESESEESESEEEPKKKGAAAPKGKGKGKAGKLVIGKFAKAVQQKGKTAKEEKKGAKPKPAVKGAAAKGDEEKAKVKGKGKGKDKAPVLSEKAIVANRKEELNKMYVADLKELAAKQGLEKGTKEAMVKDLLALEAKAREEARAREEKVKRVEKEIKEGFKSKGLNDLKELCRTKSLPVGGSKDELVARCFAAAKKEGEVEKKLSNMVAESRRAELLGLDKDKLLAICKKAGVDPLVKEVMVERIVAHQVSGGC